MGLIPSIKKQRDTIQIMKSKYARYLLVTLILAPMLFLLNANLTRAAENRISPRPADSEPFATFGYSCRNGTIKVTSMARGDDTPLKLDWDFGDGTVIQDANKKETHVYTNNGTYVVRLNVTDSDGDFDFMEKEVRVTITHYGDNVIVIDGYLLPVTLLTGIVGVMLVIAITQKNKK